jgi:hypothetical protein
VMPPVRFRRNGMKTITLLLEKLEKRKTRVPELIVSAKETTRHPSPFWV